MAASNRKTAEERREDVLRAAVAVFAQEGHGASTERIARAAGISHAYLFRLYPTKRDLFVACAQRTCDRVIAAFTAAAEGAAGGDVLLAMGAAYVELLADKELLRLQIQTWAAAASDPELAAVGRRHYGEIWQTIARLSGADADTVRAFTAQGMLLVVAASLGLTEHLEEEWVRELLPHLGAEWEAARA